MPPSNNNSRLNLCHVSSFSAENTMITVIPAFAFDDYNFPLLSSPFQDAVGPFVAGMPAQVPLWMAKLFHQRQLAQIQLPEFLSSASYLTELLRREHEYTVLTTELPYYYYEIARSLDTILEPATKVVLQDLVAIRVDKIRQHFHDLSKGDLSQGEMHMITVTGMCSVELNKIGPFLQRAFTDYGYLIRKSKDEAEKRLGGGGSQEYSQEGGSVGEKVLQESQRALAPGRNKLRRFRADPGAAAAHKE